MISKGISGELSESPKKLSVGEEFIQWAEQGWGLKQKYEITDEDSEHCDYEYMRNIFINKIDNIIKDRL